MAEPGDHRAAAARGRGRLRASHADREQAIDVLKDAFAQGRLTGDELDSRAGQALASRTYAELAAVTADLPTGSAAAPPPRQPARAQNRVPGTYTARDAATTVGFAATAVMFMATIMLGLIERSSPLVLLGLLIVIVVLPSVTVATSRQQRRSRGQLPPRPGQGGQAPELKRPGQLGNDPALPLSRPDQNRADVRSHRSRPGRPHPSGLVARAPRGIRPVPGAV
jgi:Domain of unknown function (DUF1707)